MMSNLFLIQLKANRLDAVWREFIKYQENQYKVPGELKYWHLYLFELKIYIWFNWCFLFLFSDALVIKIILGFREANQIDRAFDVVKFAVASNLPLGVDLCNKLESSPNLDTEKKYSFRLSSRTSICFEFWLIEWF